MRSDRWQFCRDEMIQLPGDYVVAFQGAALEVIFNQCRGSGARYRMYNDVNIIQTDMIPGCEAVRSGTQGIEAAGAACDQDVSACTYQSVFALSLGQGADAGDARRYTRGRGAERQRLVFQRREGDGSEITHRGNRQHAPAWSTCFRKLHMTRIHQSIERIRSFAVSDKQQGTAPKVHDDHGRGESGAITPAPRRQWQVAVLLHE